MLTAFITGGAQRIGREIVLHLAKNGWRIIFHFNTAINEARCLQEEASLYSSHVECLHIDFTDNIDTFNILNSKIHTKIDLLINNAALFNQDNVFSTQYQTLHDHLQINTIAPVILTNFFIKASANSENPNIINILDCNINDLSKNFMSYGISKNSLEYFTKIAAQDLAPNIRVNGISLGQTLRSAKQKVDNFQRDVEKSLLQKPVQIENILKTIDYIISNRNLTGEIIRLAK